MKAYQVKAYYKKGRGEKPIETFYFETAELAVEFRVNFKDAIQLFLSLKPPIMTCGDDEELDNYCDFLRLKDKSEKFIECRIKEVPFPQNRNVLKCLPINIEI